MNELLSSIPLEIVILVVGVLSLGLTLLGVVFILRAFAGRKRSVGIGESARKTFLIRLPKFKTESDVRGEDRVDQKQEDISIVETFYSAIGGIAPESGLRAWFSGRSDDIALEIVSHKKAISFYITAKKSAFSFIEQQLHAQYPDAHIEDVEDYNMFSPTGTILGGYLTFKRESILPIKTYKNLENDPLNAITNALSKIDENDGAAIQIIARPANSGWRSLGSRIVKNMNEGMSYSEAKGGGKSSWKNALKTKEAIDKSDAKMRERRLSQAEQNMLQGIEEKISKAGMEVNIRIVVSSQTPTSAQGVLNQVLQAFAQYNIYEFGNAFTKSIPRSKATLIQDFIYRKFREGYRIILNTEELASLWHLPLPTTETPNIRWLDARIAPAPSGLPTSGLHLGYNSYRGTRTEVYMNESDRQRHMYMIGKTGSGKSYLLRHLAVQDIRAGKGVAVIDPHGDLVDMILGSIPPERIDDVIYFNPADMERPMGLNMLEAPNENMRDFAVQEMISIFYMLFPPEMIGPMFEHSMRNFMLTLMSDLEHPGTIAEIPRIVADDAFQKRWIEKVTDPIVKSFWLDEMAKTSDYHKSEMMGYLVSKVGRFVENEMMRNIIGQSKSAFDFRDIMDSGKILLVNLSKGQTGEVNANLLGLIMVAKLQMAAFSRADMPEDERRDFYLYIDEFQNFITPSIATILSEARKYHLNLVLAHQYMGQLANNGDTKIRDAVLGNVGSMLASRIGPEDVEILGKVFEPTFSPYDLMNTDKFTWNAKLIANNVQLKPFTLSAVAPEEPDMELAKNLKEISRLTFGKPKELVEREIALRAGIGIKGTERTPPPIPAQR